MTASYKITAQLNSETVRIVNIPPFLGNKPESFAARMGQNCVFMFDLYFY